MVNILVVMLCLMMVFLTVLILFIYSDTMRERKERQKYAIELIERLQRKVFLLKADVTDFTERNGLMEVNFFYNFTFEDCIASLSEVETNCTDPGLLSAIKTSKREKQLNSIISDCRRWMLHINRVSSSLDKKSRNPIYNEELVCVA